MKSVQSSSTVKARSFIVMRPQWTQPWSRVQSQVDVIHLVRSTDTIMSNSHLHSVKSCLEKSRPIKYWDQMHGVMIVIEYSYKLDRKNINLWCELGRLLLRQSHIITLLNQVSAGQHAPYFLKSLSFRQSIYVSVSTPEAINNQWCDFDFKLLVE